MPNTHDIAIVGATGYVGRELVELLAHHPGVRIGAVYASGSSAGATLPDLFPRLRAVADLALEPASPERIGGAEPAVALLATPHEVSHDLAPALLDAGIRVIDLSAAFRLRDPDLYPRFYGFEHRHPDWLERTVYGLPEFHRDRIRDARIVAAPGCYPTSAILALRPLVLAGAFDPSTCPIVDAASGVSGAGRVPTDRTHFCEVSYQAYGVLSHRHGPEIDQHAGTPVHFTPHLLPLDRGILSTIHTTLRPGWNRDRVMEEWHRAYAGEPFVRILPRGTWPSIAGIVRTNFCDLACAVEDSTRHLIAFSAIDNLLKGAAGQAVQCLNLMLGFEERTSLGGSR